MGYMAMSEQIQWAAYVYQNPYFANWWPLCRRAAGASGVIDEFQHKRNLKMLQSSMNTHWTKQVFLTIPNPLLVSHILITIVELGTKCCRSIRPWPVNFWLRTKSLRRLRFENYSFLLAPFEFLLCSSLKVGCEYIFNSVNATQNSSNATMLYSCP